MNDELNNQHHASDSSSSGLPRPPYEVLLKRGLRLRCPRCGEGKLFTGFMRMHERCPLCGLRFQRGPGYYLGSTYINYGLTAGIVTVAFLVGRLMFNIPGRILLWPLFAICLIFPLLIFQRARALWLVMDCHLDKSVLEDEWITPTGEMSRSDGTP